MNPNGNGVGERVNIQDGKRRNIRFESPPKRASEKRQEPQEIEQQLLHRDQLSEAKPSPKKGAKLGFLAVQVGLAANSFMGAMKAPGIPNFEAAYEMEMASALPASMSGIGLESAMGLRTPLATQTRAPEDFTSFEPTEITRGEAEQAFEAFAEDGRVYRKKAGLFKEDLTPSEAGARLFRDKPKSVFVRLPDGQTYKIKSAEQLQELDTFLGIGVSPVESPQVVEAFQSLEAGLDTEDGFFQDEGLLHGEKSVNAFDAYKELTANPSKRGSNAMRAAGIGVGIAVAAGAVGSFFFPGLAPTIMLGAGAAGLTVGAAAGAIGYNHIQELEVRQGQDSGLVVRDPGHVLEAHEWLEARAANPFTQDQQAKALEYLDDAFGLYDGKKSIDADKALERLHKGKDVQVPSRIPGRSDTLSSLRDLQKLDTLKGSRVNPVFTQEISDGLQHFEAGVGATDGLYRQGETDPKKRLTALEAANYLFQDRKNVGVTVKGKAYQTKSLYNIEELNALKGQGNNTILPEADFQALRFFDQVQLMTEVGAETPKQVDSYEALQEMNEGRGVLVESHNRQALALSPTDLHELRSLEFDRVNEILPERDFQLLNFWQDRDGYETDGDGGRERGYEALQSIQARNEFEVVSGGRLAPALSFQDLEDLATFEAPTAGFEDNVDAVDKDRLIHFQRTNEQAGQRSTKVGERTGRAYEGWRQLRDGRPFEVNAGNSWNRIIGSQDLHELDALLGRGENDILPQAQYDLLKELGDGQTAEGLRDGSTVLNSYKALQEFQAGGAITYDFNGGDFGERLRIGIPGIDSLGGAKTLRDNQKEYDRYAYSVPEWQDKMDRQLDSTPGLASSNLRRGKDNLSDAESDLRRAKDDLSDGERDLRRAKDDKRDAEWDLTRARLEPTTKTEYRRVCDVDNVCTQEAYDVHNHERDRLISSANSDISRAKRDIREAEADIREAKSDISSANRDIDTAEDEIQDANRLIRMLPDYEDLVDGATPTNYRAVIEELQSKAQTMKRLSRISSLDSNLGRQQKLMTNMTTRPARPEGWEVPEQLVQR